MGSVLLLLFFKVHSIQSTRRLFASKFPCSTCLSSLVLSRSSQCFGWALNQSDCRKLHTQIWLWPGLTIIHRSGGGSWWLFTEAAKRIFIGLPAVRPIKFSLASRLSPKKKKRRTHNPEVFAYPVLMRPSVASEEKSFPFPAKVVG